MFRLAVLGVSDRSRAEIGRRLHRARTQADPSDADGIAILKSPDRPIRTDELAAVFSDPAVAAVPILLVPGIESGLVPESTTTDELRVTSSDGIRDNPMLWTANPQRFDPALAAIKGQLSHGNLGLPGVLRMHHWQSAIAGPWWKPWPGDWRCLLDVVLWLMGGPPRSVFAVHQSADQGNECEGDSGGGNDHDSIGTLQLHCAWAFGGMALVTLSDQLPPGDSYRTTMLIGSTGAAYHDDHQNRQLILRGGTAGSILDEGPLLSHVAMLQHFVDNVADSEVTAGDGRADRGALKRSFFDAADVRRLLTIAETSMTSGQAQAWEDF